MLQVTFLDMIDGAFLESSQDLRDAAKELKQAGAPAGLVKKIRAVAKNLYAYHDQLDGERVKWMVLEQELKYWGEAYGIAPVTNLFFVALSVARRKFIDMGLTAFHALSGQEKGRLIADELERLADEMATTRRAKEGAPGAAGVAIASPAGTA